MSAKIIPISASTPYNVIIDRNILKTVGSLTGQLDNQSYKRVAIITDSNVDKLYANPVVDSFSEAGFKVYKYVFPAGENSKSLSNLLDIVSWLVENQFTRKDLLVALGGGVCGDLVGFTASVYLRGIDFIQIPTTLLSSIDSSVGGKTAVNIPEGKNLVGTFWQPRLVIIDTTTLDTLKDYDFASGVAEAIKAGAIWDKELFSVLASPGWRVDQLDQVIASCVEIKRQVVEKDEKEQNLRAILNFGHTVGHGVEKLSGLMVPHGHAVATGMYIIAKAGESAGITKAGTAEKIKASLVVNGLPTATDYTAEQLAEAALGDKKRTGDNINIITLTEIGNCEITKMPIASLDKFIKGGL